MKVEEQAIVLTYNAYRHLRECLENLALLNIPGIGESVADFLEAIENDNAWTTMADHLMDLEPKLKTPPSTVSPLPDYVRPISSPFVKNGRTRRVVEFLSDRQVWIVEYSPNTQTWVTTQKLGEVRYEDNADSTS
jgi:hypothetical protein